MSTIEAILIPTHTPAVLIELDATNNLADLQRHVGGYIQYVTLPKNAEGHPLYNHNMVLNEDGNLLGLKPNYLASNLFGVYLRSALVGQAVLVGPIDKDGNLTSVTEDAKSILVKS